MSVTCWYATAAGVRRVRRFFSEWGLRAESVVGGLLEIRLAQGSPAADRANISELHDVLETVDNALDDAV